MDYTSISILLGAILALASVLLGVKYEQGKAKAKQLISSLNIIIKAAEDDRVTEKEFQKIITSTKAVLEKSGEQAT